MYIHLEANTMNKRKGEAYAIPAPSRGPLPSVLVIGFDFDDDEEGLATCATCTTCGLPRPKTFRNEPGECIFSHMVTHSPPLNESCACSRESCGRAECAEAARR
jgi:hypothetical protein